MLETSRQTWQFYAHISDLTLLLLPLHRYVGSRLLNSCFWSLRKVWWYTVPDSSWNTTKASLKGPQGHGHMCMLVLHPPACNPLFCCRIVIAPGPYHGSFSSHLTFNCYLPIRNFSNQAVHEHTVWIVPPWNITFWHINKVLRPETVS